MLEHEHVFLGADHQRNERRVWFVIALTAVMMVVEIGAGTLYGSMALVADGWHMSTHASALLISARRLSLCAPAGAQSALYLRHRQARRSGRLCQRHHSCHDRAADGLGKLPAHRQSGADQFRPGDRRRRRRPCRQSRQRLAAARTITTTIITAISRSWPSPRRMTHHDHGDHAHHGGKPTTTCARPISMSSPMP